MFEVGIQLKNWVLVASDIEMLIIDMISSSLTLSIEYWALSIEYRVLSIEHWVLSIEDWALDRSWFETIVNQSLA